MYTLFVIIHILVCVTLCVVVLLQSSKGGGLAGAFGGGGGVPQQIFGSRGMTTILHKLTIYCAVGFFLTSAILFGLTARRSGPAGSVVQEAVNQGTLSSDVTPAAPLDADVFPAQTADETPAGTTGEAATDAASGADASAGDTESDESTQP